MKQHQMQRSVRLLPVFNMSVKTEVRKLGLSSQTLFIVRGRISARFILGMFSMWACRMSQTEQLSCVVCIMH